MFFWPHFSFEIALGSRSSKEPIERDANNWLCFLGLDGWRTPLATAVQYGELDVIRMLLAQPDVDINKCSPLRIAILKGDITAVKMLLSAGSSTKPSGTSSDRVAIPYLSLAAYIGLADIAELLMTHSDLVQ